MKQFTRQAQIDYLEQCNQIEWKVISGFENYSISSEGDVKNNITGRILIPGTNGKGYYQVYLSDGKGNYKRLYVHRLVAEAFIANPENKPEVDHISRLKDDNRAENLRWTTPSENCLNRDFSLMKHKHVLQYNLNGNLIKEYNSVNEVAKELNLKLRTVQNSISENIHGKRKTYKGYIWKYKESK